MSRSGLCVFDWLYCEKKMVFKYGAFIPFCKGGCDFSQRTGIIYPVQLSHDVCDAVYCLYPSMREGE